MSEESEKREILDGLKPMFQQAKLLGLWFHCGYQNLWFHPEELRKAHLEGRFIWGAVNYELCDPQEKIDSLKKEIEQAENKLANFEKRLDQ